MWKQNSRTFPGLFQDFFIFQGLNFFPILYKTLQKNALFSPGNVQIKRRSCFLWFWFRWLKLGLPHKMNRIEYKSHLALQRVSSDFHSVFFCDFHTVFFAHPIKREMTSCIWYFSRTNSYFQGWFYKIPGQFEGKRLFFLIPGVFHD